MRNKILFYINGKRHSVASDKAHMMLAEYLRYDQGLTGTKIVCAEGDCGACSVLRYFPHAGLQESSYLPVNSCITLVAQLDGSSLVTVDALNTENGLHESQRAMVECHGSQCGFCTPGFVVALTGLVEEKIRKEEMSLSSQEAKNSMTGNLCRCTGYQPIIDAALNIDLTKCQSVKERFFSIEQKMDLHNGFATTLKIESPDFSFYAPKTIQEAVEYLNLHPDVKIVGAATDLGVVRNKRKLKLTHLLSLHLIPELYGIKLTQNEISLGARVTLSELRSFLKKKLPEFAHYLDIFASPQIKNIGTVVGNVANASPIGDTPPVLMALNAIMNITGPKGSREVPISEFFVGYRKTQLEKGELITGIRFNLPSQASDFRAFKSSNRKDLDISSVNVAIKVDWKNREKKEIQDIFIAAGGVAATAIRFKKTEQLLKSQSLTPSLMDQAVVELHSEFKPLSDVRASSSYRHVLVENYFRRFFHDVQREAP